MKLAVVTALSLTSLLANALPQASSGGTSDPYPLDGEGVSCQVNSGGPGVDTFKTVARVFREKFLDNGDTDLEGQSQISGKYNDDWCMSCSGGVLYFQNSGADSSDRTLTVDSFDSGMQELEEYADYDECTLTLQSPDGQEDPYMNVLWGNDDSLQRDDDGPCPNKC
ncbi:MAG: hypothetical protein M1833_006081 [Piccolia ochrophora]|nr:MAG: hypothetical protein M1833_006081 [Piccolia ochrophora]